MTRNLFFPDIDPISIKYFFITVCKDLYVLRMFLCVCICVEEVTLCFINHIFSTMQILFKLTQRVNAHAQPQSAHLHTLLRGQQRVFVDTWKGYLTDFFPCR